MPDGQTHSPNDVSATLLRASGVSRIVGQPRFITAPAANDLQVTDRALPQDAGIDAPWEAALPADGRRGCVPVEADPLIDEVRRPLFRRGGSDRELGASLGRQGMVADPLAGLAEAQADEPDVLDLRDDALAGSVQGLASAHLDPLDQAVAEIARDLLGDPLSLDPAWTDGQQIPHGPIAAPRPAARPSGRFGAARAHAPSLKLSGLRTQALAVPQSGYAIRFGWGEYGARHLGADAGTVILVDLFGVSTCVDVACSRGAVLFSVDDPQAASSDVLSPWVLQACQPGAELVMAAAEAHAIATTLAPRSAQLLAGCLRNASAVAQAALRRGGPITVVTATEPWPDGGLRPGLQDLICAGAILSKLPAAGRSPQARLAIMAWQLIGNYRARCLGMTPQGAALLRRRRHHDLMIALREDVSDTVPVWRDGAFRAP